MMLSAPAGKYRPFATVDLPDRQWPNRRLTQPPRWCSVDLRDGNQSLIDPMDGERKSRFFDLLVKTGFKEIEVAFPSASQTDFDFVRGLIEGRVIPEDVAIQVLTQSREELIRRTIDSLDGAHRAIVHLYNATSELFRRLVFNQDRAGTIALAVAGTRLIKQLTDERPGTIWTYEYSPETFSFTELDFALEVCEAVMDVWQPTPERPIILNLPATVEVATPNIYADQIEWFCRHMSRRDCAVISVHPHNDPRHRHRRRGARADGRGRPCGGLLVRQWRAHRQCRHRDDGAEPLHAGGQPRPRLLGHPPRRAYRRALQPDRRASAPPLCGRAGLHCLLGLASGCDQEGVHRADDAEPMRSGKCPTCRSTRRTSAAPTRR